MTRRYVLLALLGLLVIAGVLKGISYWTVGRFQIETNNAYVESDRVIIAPRVAGYITQVPVQDNQAVRAGTILVQLEDAEYRAKLAEAQGAVAVARAGIAAAKATAVRQRSAIDEAEADIIAAQAGAARAAGDLQRYETLRDEKWISAQRYQAAEADAAAARASVARSKAALASQSGQVAVLSTTAQNALAQYQVAMAKVQSAQVDLDNTLIRAPRDGVIANRMARIGQYARPGTQLMAVVPVGDIFVVANFKETQLARLRVGQSVRLKADAFPDAAITGRIDSFAPATGARFSMLPPENATGNFTKTVQRIPVRIRITASPVQLSDGMSIVAQVNTMQPVK